MKTTNKREKTNKIWETISTNTNRNTNTCWPTCGALKTRSCSGLELQRALKTDPIIHFSFLIQYYYPHTLRESVYPVCVIFFFLSQIKILFSCVNFFIKSIYFKSIYFFNVLIIYWTVNLYSIFVLFSSGLIFFKYQGNYLIPKLQPQQKVFFENKNNLFISAEGVALLRS